MIFRKSYKFAFAAVLLLLSCISLHAQNHSIEGKVTGEDGARPIAGAVIMFLQDGKDGKYYCISGPDGAFELRLPEPPGSKDSLRVSILGYETKIISADVSGFIEITLEIKPMNIKQVVVSAPKVELFGDTVEFNVQGFAEQQDKNIEDVLKRMPGIKVDDSGDIYYNGEQIGNLYIEDMDVLGGRYTLLTKNISPEDVKSVQVIERHQPVKVLSGIMPGKKPAINLRLRESSKGKWIGSAALAGGYSSDTSALWNGNAFLMRIGRKWNSVNNIKTDNTGGDIRQELLGRSVYDRSYSPGGGGFISVGTSNAPLEGARVRFNTSAMGNTSNTWKLDDDWILNASLSYSFDRLKSDNSSSTVYFFENRADTVRESESAMTRAHFLHGRVEVQANKKEYYFRNVLSAMAEYKDAVQQVRGDFPNTQQAFLPFFEVDDDLSLVRRFGDLSVSVTSQNSFSLNDQRLEVLRDEGRQEQRVLVRDFNTDTWASATFNPVPGFSIGVKGGLDASVRSLESVLRLSGNASGLVDGKLDNDLVTGYVRPYVSPYFNYDSKHWELNVSLPLSWAYYWYVGAGRFIYSAMASAKYKIGPKWSVTLGGNAANTPLSIFSFYDGYIMSNYRNISKGAMNTSQNEIYAASLNVNFKDPVNMLYLSGGVSRSWNVYHVSSNRDFVGDYIVSATDFSRASGKGWNASLSGSMGVYGINGRAGFSLSYSNYSSDSMLQDGVRTPYLSQTVSFAPDFSGRLASWLRLSYRLAFSYNVFSLPGTATSDDRHDLYQSLGLNFTPAAGLDMELSAEHYYTTLDGGTAKHTVLADASVSYTFKGGVQVGLMARNILDNRLFAYSVFDALTSFSCQYAIRPFNIIASVSFRF